MRIMLTVLAAIWAFESGSFAQEIMKLPRVVELEDSLKDSASEYVKARFPSIPFMVTIRVDPMRRDSHRRDAYSNDNSVYFDPDEDEEIKDEWDNLQIPLKGLINRVKRITVSVSVPAKLRESDVNELREGIFSILHLTQARDEVQIARRDWVTEEVPWLAIYVGCGVLTALLVGLLVINRTSANRIARALSEMKAGSSQPAASAGVPSMGSLGAEAKVSDRKSQELTFNDPIKMKELATRHIQFLSTSSSFPNHRDIFMLDKLGHEDPEKLGAILAEFPAEMQNRLFSYSAGFHWVEALNEPGFLDFECLELIQALTQNPRKDGDHAWNHAVLAVWRLNENRTPFIRSLSKDEAFAILAAMPKAIAVHEARKAFPGSWAALLEPDFEAKRIASERIKEIHEGAIRIVPLNQIDLVRRYRDERELLEYLKTVDPNEERDIYGALPESSMVHKLRPPFYPIFDQTADELIWFVPTMALEHWALALFNLPKSERGKIDAQLSEKQRFLLIERFKKFDQAAPNPGAVSDARASIGAALKRFLTNKKTADAVNGNLDDSTSDAKNNDDAKAA